MHRLVAAAVLLAASIALADGGQRLDIELGKEVQVDVGYATGWFCDDSSILSADMITRADHNFWVVTGQKLGTTDCRVGTDLARVHFVFEVHVVPAKAKPH